ncbi:hypothetical protein MarSH_355 [Marseillevirus Shanghai 1]|nr:hypothetical protein MarSH_355 [Marseillevirus Shanghai 1]
MLFSSQRAAKFLCPLNVRNARECLWRSHATFRNGGREDTLNGEAVASALIVVVFLFVIQKSAKPVLAGVSPATKKQNVGILKGTGKARGRSLLVLRKSFGLNVANASTVLRRNSFLSEEVTFVPFVRREGCATSKNAKFVAERTKNIFGARN